MKSLYITIFSLVLFVSCSSNQSADAYGSFESDEIVVSSEVNGTILKYLKSEGEFIPGGEVVAIIDTTTYYLSKLELEKNLSMIQLKITSAEQQKDILEVEKNNAILNRDRISNLTQQQAAPQKQLDDIENSLQVLDKKITQAETNILLARKEYEASLVKMEKAELLLQKCFAKAPKSGVILEQYSEAGEFSSAGRPLFKLADISKMKAVFYLGEPQLAGLQLGDEVKIAIDVGKGMKEYVGKLTYISERAEFTPKTIQTKDERVKLVYKAEAEVVNDGSIKIGMPLEVRFLQ